MQAALDQNTKGVTLLTSGLHHEAVQCFKKALFSLQVACDNVSSSGPETSDATATPAATVRFERRLSEDNRSSYLISSAAENSYESCTICGALIMFNLGVAFQYYGHITRVKPEMVLKKAGLLYNQCLHLMSALPDSFEDEKNQISSAALSYLADVCYALGDANGVRCALDDLLILHLRSYVMNEDIDSRKSIAPAA